MVSAKEVQAIQNRKRKWNVFDSIQAFRISRKISNVARKTSSKKNCKTIYSIRPLVQQKLEKKGFYVEGDYISW